MLVDVLAKSVISYQESGVRSQLSGVRSQESGVRRRELGDRRRETGDYFYLFSPHPTPHFIIHNS
ncbi:MAG: hypothetical protein EWV91_13680 [Microcystis aeruginosa Ma_QC_Ca_00000000_S207]|uniref:Uncharacterized protein n=1 Tax=Microcystis aeruginosa Ma_QC_Ca_00000000_S207 TaxID=2486251 RepID=A0A552FH44_MICAE|nr:MAG: hypothetical protein EWV91_13680 [Microcystis aeruginosa Ma_QC_Ca_00000000_S207]